eukprot:1216311-Alexandrium_andersonii.AAC.1
MFPQELVQGVAHRKVVGELGAEAAARSTREYPGVATREVPQEHVPTVLPLMFQQGRWMSRKAPR